MANSDFQGTIEMLKGRNAAIVTLIDAAGEWSGSQLIEIRKGSRQDLYEAGYNYASVSAQGKGGRLSTYKWA